MNGMAVAKESEKIALRRKNTHIRKHTFDMLESVCNFVRMSWLHIAKIYCTEVSSSWNHKGFLWHTTSEIETREGERGRKGTPGTYPNTHTHFITKLNIIEICMTQRVQHKYDIVFLSKFTTKLMDGPGHAKCTNGGKGKKLNQTR